MACWFSKFMSSVLLPHDSENDCWVWSKGKYTSGYGAISICGKPEYAHRVSYKIFKGPIESGLEVRHLCHNRSCVNPAHLELGTHQDNADDMVKAGRSARGQNHSQAKLTEVEVREIKKLLSDGHTQNSIAKTFGIDQSTVSNIKSGRRWGHVDV